MANVQRTSTNQFVANVQAQKAGVQTLGGRAMVAIPIPSSWHLYPCVQPGAERMGSRRDRYSRVLTADLDLRAARLCSVSAAKASGTTTHRTSAACGSRTLLPGG